MNPCPFSEVGLLVLAGKEVKDLVAQPGRDMGDSSQQLGVPGNNEFGLPSLAGFHDLDGQPVRTELFQASPSAGQSCGSWQALGMLLVAIVHLFPGDGAGADQQDMDAAGSQFHSQLLAIGSQRELACRVGSQVGAGDE